jgi:hypothetical protein
MPRSFLSEGGMVWALIGVMAILGVGVFLGKKILDPYFEEQKNSYRLREAMTLFTVASPTRTSSSVAELLQFGCKGLDLDMAILNFGERKNFSASMQQIASVGSVDSYLAYLQQHFPQSYCAKTVASHSLLCIDYASISEWRNHPAHKALGFETYLGISVPLDHSLTASLAFFSKMPRKQFFSPEEREFAQTLGKWVISDYKRFASAEKNRLTG